MKVKFIEGKGEFVEHFLRFIEISAGDFMCYLLGNRWKKALKACYLRNEGIFSFRNTLFAKYEDHIAGMVLSYSWFEMRKGKGLTGMIFLKVLGVQLLFRIFRVLKMEFVGNLKEGDYYISNIAVYKKFRGMGIGRALMLEVKEPAKRTGSRRIVLDVDEKNKGARSFYQKLGFKEISKIRIGPFIFLRLVQPVV